MSLQTFEIESLDQIDDGSVSVALNKAIRAKGRTISVRPYPGSLDIAKAKSVEALRRKVTELLEADETKVFAGTP